MPGFNIPNAGLSDPSLPDHTVETHRVHRWVIRSFGFPNSILGSQTRAQPSLRVYAKNAVLPTVGFETQMAPGASVDYPYAAKATFEPVTIAFYDVLGLYTLFDRWRDAIWTPDEGIKQLDGYVGEPVIVKTDGVGNETQLYRLKNAFPKSITHTDLTYDSSDILLVKVTYIYSHFEYEELQTRASGF